MAEFKSQLTWSRIALLGPEYEGISILPNVGNYLTVQVA
jgi:hypothetical protein